VQLGFDDADKYLSDSDLDPIRSDSRFRALVESMGGQQADRRVRQAMEKLEETRKDAAAEWHDWANAGVALLRVRKLPEAIEALRRSVEMNPANDVGWHNLACAYALDRDTRQAIDALSKSVVDGNGSADRIIHDPDLASLRGERQFIELVQLARDLELGGMKHNNIFGDDDVQQWRRALPEYERLAREHANVGRAWFNLGFARLRAGEARTAADAFQRALSLGYRPATSKYNVACSLSVAGEIDQAFRYLDDALAANRKLIAGYARGDHDLKALRNDPRFDAVRDAIRELEKMKEDKHKDDDE